MALAVGSLACGGLLAEDGSLVIAVRGGSVALPVVISEKPTATESEAARELRETVAAMTGVSLPVVTGTNATAGVFIRCDPSAGRGDDGFTLAVRDRSRLEVTGGVRGVLYGVYELLERFGSVDWFSADFTLIPPADRFAVPLTLDETQRPAFRHRSTSLLFKTEADDAYCSHRRFLMTSRDLPERYGGRAATRFSGWLGNCHTFKKLVPPDRYAKSHPEYYALVDGARMTSGAQLCLTNPDVVRIACDSVARQVRANPSIRYFGASQMDNQKRCQCERCAASDLKYGVRQADGKVAPRPAGTILAFVNAIADAVRAVRKDAVVETLSYQYSQQAPVGIVPRDNVMICLCSIACDFGTPMEKSPYPQDVRFCRDLGDWGRLTSNLFIWDYTVNFHGYLAPFLNFDSLQENIRLFRRHGATFVFEQGNSRGRLTWYGDLRRYLLSKLLWNPDADVAVLKDRFFRGCYGPAAELVRRDFDAFDAIPLGRSADREDVVTIYESLSKVRTAEALEASVKLWRAAGERVANDTPQRRKAVRDGLLCAEFARLMRYEADKRGSPSEMKALAAHLVSVCTATNSGVRFAESTKRNDKLMNLCRTLTN